MSCDLKRFRRRRTAGTGSTYRNYVEIKSFLISRRSVFLANPLQNVFSFRQIVFEEVLQREFCKGKFARAAGAKFLEPQTSQVEFFFEKCSRQHLLANPIFLKENPLWEGFGLKKFAPAARIYEIFYLAPQIA